MRVRASEVSYEGLHCWCTGKTGDTACMNDLNLFQREDFFLCTPYRETIINAVTNYRVGNRKWVSRTRRLQICLNLCGSGNLNYGVNMAEKTLQKIFAMMLIFEEQEFCFVRI